MLFRSDEMIAESGHPMARSVPRVPEIDDFPVATAPIVHNLPCADTAKASRQRGWKVLDLTRARDGT